MKVTVDTNFLVRAAMRDDEDQARVAAKLLESADVIAVPSSCLCEFVWVLRRLYKLGPLEIAAAIDALLETDNVVLDRPAVEAGLMMLKAGGDFADGMIAHEGQWLGGETFASFDKQAVALMVRDGQQAMLLG